MMSEGPYTVYVECMTFNHEPYIADALRGFIRQETSFPFIVVIIDDASTDGTASVIKRFVEDCFDIADKSIAYDLETEEGYLSFAQHKTNRNC